MSYETRASWERRGRPYQPEGFLQEGGLQLVKRPLGAPSLIQCPYLTAPFESLASASSRRCRLPKKQRFQGIAAALEVSPYMVRVHGEGGRRINQRVSSESQRGIIDSFSRRSQRRMRRRVLMVGELPSEFFGLTYPDDVLVMRNSNEIAEKVHRDVDVVVKRLVRRFPKIAGVVRYEWTYRKSGSYAGMLAVHLHILTYRGPGAEVLRLFMLDAWPSIIGTKDPNAGGVLCEEKAFQDFKGDIRKVEGYLSKYIAKEGGSMGFRTGRHWGTFGNLPEYESIIIEVGRWEASKVIRILRSFCQSKKRTWDISRQLYRGDVVDLRLGKGDIMKILMLAADLAEIPF